MTVLETRVAHDNVYTARRTRMEGLVAELRERTGTVARGGGEEALERHRSRGKLTARERIDRLLDPGTALLELNALAAGSSTTAMRPLRGSSRASASSRAATASSSPTTPL